MDLNQLSALEEVRLVKARYCRYIDTRQWAAFSQLFVADASLTFYDVGGAVLYRFTTLEQFLASTIETLVNARSIHQVHNSEIEFPASGFASAIWSMEDRINFADGSPHSMRSLHGYGHYYETLVLTEGQWRIQTLELKRTFLRID